MLAAVAFYLMVLTGCGKVEPTTPFAKDSASDDWATASTVSMSAAASMSATMPTESVKVAATPSKRQEEAHRIEINGMNLAEAVGIAISRHPDVSRAGAIVAQGASQVAVAKAAWYPNIDYGLRPGYGESYGYNNSQSGLTGSLGATQLLYDFKRTSSQISAAESILSQQRHLFDDTINTVAYNTAATFIEVAASQDTVVAAQRQVTALRDIHSKISQRVRGGLSNVSDLNQADVATQRAEAEVLTAQTRFNVAIGKLAELIGVRPQRVASLAATQGFVEGLGGSGRAVERSPLPSAARAATEIEASSTKMKVGELQVVDNSADIIASKPAGPGGAEPRPATSTVAMPEAAPRFGDNGENVEQTPSVLAANAAAEAATARVRVAEAERWPSLSVGASRTMSTTPYNAADTSFAGVIINGGFSLGGLVKNKVAAAEAERQAAMLTLENQRLVVRTALGSAETEAAGAAARLVSYEKVIELTVASRDLYWQEYTLNNRPLTDVINAEREIYQADVERTNAAADGAQAKIKVYTAVGQFTKLLRDRAGDE